MLTGKQGALNGTYSRTVNDTWSCHPPCAPSGHEVATACCPLGMATGHTMPVRPSCCWPWPVEGVNHPRCDWKWRTRSAPLATGAPPGTRCRVEGGAPTWRRAGRAAVPSSPRGPLRRRRAPSCRQRGGAAPPPPAPAPVATGPPAFLPARARRRRPWRRRAGSSRRWRLRRRAAMFAARRREEGSPVSAAVSRPGGGARLAARPPSPPVGASFLPPQLPTHLRWPPCLVAPRLPWPLGSPGPAHPVTAGVWVVPCQAGTLLPPWDGLLPLQLLGDPLQWGHVLGDLLHGQPCHGSLAMGRCVGHGETWWPCLLGWPWLLCGRATSVRCGPPALPFWIYPPWSSPEERLNVGERGLAGRWRIFVNDLS